MEFPSKESVPPYGELYVPEKFTREEQYLLAPFFSNLDKPCYIVRNLPPEVGGALASRYSRLPGTLRRTFFNEYIREMVYPEVASDWERIPDSQKIERQKSSSEFRLWVDSFHNGACVDTRRGRAFFGRWLLEYGDDSIAELTGGIMVCFEGVSNVVVNTMEMQRIGISPIEKSSRFVSFSNTDERGKYPYVTPHEIISAGFEVEYEALMDKLFTLYSKLERLYFDYVKTHLFPIESDESSSVFERSRKAKVFDDIRDLLPFSTKTNVAFSGNARAFENLINRLIANPISEARYWGHMAYNELYALYPSLFSRVGNERGADVQIYRREYQELASDHVGKYLTPREKNGRFSKEQVTLSSYDKEGVEKVIAAHLFHLQNSGMTEEEVLEVVRNFTGEERAQIMGDIFSVRHARGDVLREKTRHRRVPRAFEASQYIINIVSRGGDLRDLMRHRMLTFYRHELTTRFGWRVEEDLRKFVMYPDIESVFLESEALYEKIVNIDPLAAQYIVPFAFFQSYSMHLTAREIFWLCELRSGEAGKSAYRKIAQDISTAVRQVHPLLFAHMHTDYNQYGLARKSALNRIDSKLRQQGYK